MSYIDIPLTNEYIFFELINHQTGLPVINPQFPIGIGQNYNVLYDLGCGIKIDELLAEYNLTRADVFSAKLYLYGNNSVGNMDVFSTSGEISDSPIIPTNFNYEVPLEETYDSIYCGYLFKMSTPDAISYSTFHNNINSCLRIGFNQPSVSSIYVDGSNSRSRFFNGDTPSKSDFKVKAVLSDETEFELTNFTSPLFETTLNTSITSITFTAKIGTIEGYSTSPFKIEVFLWGNLNVNYGQNGNNSQQTFDIYGPSEDNQIFPVVVTIHGGEFTNGQKEDYNYITPFLLNNGFIHVNMDYRLMSISNENNIYTNTNGIHYQDMLGDIKSLINYL